jgi:hypothetical protein
MELKLQNNGDIKIKYYDEESKEFELDFYDPKKQDEKKVLTLLQFPIELEENFTLRSYFNLVIKYPALSLIDGFFPGYIEEFFKCPDSGCVEGILSAISLCRVISIEKDQIEFYVSVSGVGKEKDTESYAIEFTPLKNLLDLPIILEEAMVTTIPNSTIVKTPKPKIDTLRYTTYYSLWDFLHAIIYELSFCGFSEERDAKFDELQTTLKDYEAGKGTSVPIENLWKDIEKE